jgi:hypothetical protein
VVSLSTGEAVAGAEVTVSDSSVVTDEDGRFAIPDLPRGAHAGVVSLEGFPRQEFSVDLSQGDQDLVVELVDSILNVQVSENALEPTEIAEVRIALDGIESTTSPAVFRRIPPGDYALLLESNEHESYESTVSIEPGENTIAVELDLTPVETYRRFVEAQKYRRGEVGYGYLHPDERELISLDRWLTEAGKGIEVLSVTFGDVRLLDSWKSSLTDRTYENVAEVDRTIESQVIDPQYSDYGVTFSDSASQCWVKVEGLWYLVHKEEW